MSLFLIISTASAEEIISDDSNSAIDVLSDGLDNLDNGDNIAVLSDGNLGNGDNDAVLSDGNLDIDDNNPDLPEDNTDDGENEGDSSGDSPASDDSGSNSENPSLSNSSDGNSAVQFNSTPYKCSSTKDIVSTYGKKVKFSVKVLNKEGKAINHTLVRFKIRGKTYNRYTNLSGIAYITLNLNAGKYGIYYYAGNISGKRVCTVRNYYKMIYYKWKSGANVLKNKRIKANVPNSAVVKRIIKLARYGTPLIKFKGGNGKVVFITAGVHGNEIPSQVAAMHLIKYLETHAINGTVYVMPFVNPKATAANVRDYKGVHLNKLANKKGTISYKIVQRIKKFKCNSYGDFHATRPGGKPGKDVAMGTYKPTKASSTIANYISKNAKVKCIIYNKAGAEYPGALEDEVNLKGIPAVTCEVISPHGKIKKGAVSKSLLMMKTLLKYNSVL